MNEAIESPKKFSQLKILKRHKRPTTVTLSKNWDAKVEKLFLSQSFFPFVNFFQKWYILISTNWAIKYAIIEANAAIGDREKTFLYNASLIGEYSTAGSISPKNNIPAEKKDANIPAITIKFALLLPYISDIKSVIRKVSG